MKTDNAKINVITDFNPYQSGEVILGNLTEKQYAALEDVVRLSPGYHFTVVRYSGGPSSRATYVHIWSDANKRDFVGLVGKDCADAYDANKETKKVVLRVSHRVYR